MLLKIMAFLKKYLIIILFLFIISGTVFSLDVEFPAIQAFAYYPYNSDQLPGKNNYRITADVYYSNIYMFNVDRSVINDFEAASLVVGAGYGLSEDTVVEFYLKGSVLYGGIMDKLIMDFHEVFGLNEGGRGEYPRNKVNIRNGEYFSYQENQFVLSSPVVGIVSRLYGNRGLEILVRGGVGIPLNSRPGLVSNNPFLNTGIIFVYKKGKTAVKLSGYLSFFKRPKWIDPEKVSSRMFMTNGEIISGRVFGGFILRTSPFLGGDISNKALQIYLGYKISNSLKISMFEEIPPMDTIPDVTFRISFSFDRK